MKSIFIFLAFVLLAFGKSNAMTDSSPDSKQSYYKLTTSNGLIVAVYNVKANHIDYVYPHIFANIDSAHYVHPFIGNITLKSKDTPIETMYEKNTHVIHCKYKDYSVYYFSSFTKKNKVFYVVARGPREKIEPLDFDAETGNGNKVSGITLLENPLEDLPCILAGKALTGSILKNYKTYSEKYFLYSFTDPLHKDSTIIKKEIELLSKRNNSLVDEEIGFMQKIFSSCKLPKALTIQERNLAEQSISILKMSQVADNEIFPLSHGQILASLRPGLWHIAWVRDGSYSIEAMTRLGMYAEARKGLEFMLKAPSNRFKHYIYKDGKDYGPGIDYQVSLTRYFGNGTEECDYNEYGPNIEFDDFGLFLTAFSDYELRSNDLDFYKKWGGIVSSKVADAIIACMDSNSLIKADSGPWEHHLDNVKQYAFTSGVCARGLQMFAQLQKKHGLPFLKYQLAADKIKKAILKNMLVDNDYLKGNASDKSPSDHEYYDAGVFEVFANGLMNDKKLFSSQMAAYDKSLRIKGTRPGYIRLSSADPYENQEWVFINLRIASTYLYFQEKAKAGELLHFVTRQASVNYNTIPEMYSNRLQMDKVTENFLSSNIWCNCIRKDNDEYIGTIPMVGYGSAVYILALSDYYNR